MAAVAHPTIIDRDVADPTRRRGYFFVVRILLGVVCFFVVGNLLILGLHLVLRDEAGAEPAIEGIDNFTVVDDRLWRGAAPQERGLRSLAASGVTTVVDLRAEEDIVVDEALLAELGLRRVHLPIRDGQSPGGDVVERFLQIVEESDGRVFVHCGAGVGRTGTLAAAWLVHAGDISSGEAVRRNLAVGPPSLEQIAFAARLEGGDVSRPPLPVVVVSRVLDAPRRFWVGVRNSYEG